MLLPHILAIILGLIALVWSSDQFVNSAASVAKLLGMSTLMIGLTVVSFGTSAPEIMVAINSAINNSPGIAVGNAVGSNIANIGLVLGITALVCALPIRSGLIKREVPLLLLVTGITGFLMADLELTVIDGIVLLSLLPLTLFIFHKFSISSHEGSEHDVAEDELEEEVADLPEMTTGKAWVLLVVSLVVLVGSAHMLVWGASGVARELGVSELVIGLTIVAIGTSLPELAASVASALKGHHDLAIGNVIGSNLFNLMTVLSVPGLIITTSVEPLGFTRDYFVMLALTVALAFFMFLKSRTPVSASKGSSTQESGKLTKFHGLLFLGAYTTYMVQLYLSSTAN
ncbi:calcium/sodium antiporter [Litoribrevibacter albus]|uniref:Sodium:calcium antiporter n=1 Tax=Litoribrevibacter albus TaxID=1473156 RepID=A0AA37SAX4_9GAMM|nr:calcium/sodium antiporter [Litoribrevibacter albus]GLQ31294.1 sodium:calcium antiporter [Litoribrevibacter albus]